MVCWILASIIFLFVLLEFIYKVKKSLTPTLDFAVEIGEAATSRDDKNPVPMQLYYFKEAEYHDLLSQELAWKLERQRMEASLERDREQWQYDLENKRLTLEYQIKERELNISEDALVHKQQLQIESLKLENSRLKARLDSLLQLNNLNQSNRDETA